MEDWRKIIKENINMKNMNTLKIEAIAKYYSEPENIERLKDCINFAKKNDLEIFILGNGSNIIFSKDYYEDTLFINMKNFKKIQRIENKIVVEAGVKSKDLINFCIKNEISGFEFLAGIPGSIGGMIKMNAGAFGREISELLDELKIFDINSYEIEWIEKESIEFKYRELIGLDKKIIIAGKFRVSYSSKNIIKNKVKEFLKIRKKKQPSGFSAGSIFKNPENNFAGKLIEECNLKGFSFNDAFISEKHANFIINKGNAKGKDILKLIEIAKNKVKNKFGIDLGEEVKIV